MIHQQQELENPQEVHQKISQLLQQGYSEIEVIKIIQSRKFNPSNESLSQKITNIENLPQKMQNEIQNHDEMQSLLKQYKKNDTYLFKKSENQDELLYDELLEQIIEGNSIMDNETYQKAQQLVKKPFSRKDLLKVEKQRQLKLEQRAEIELVKKQILDESNFEKQNFQDKEYSFIDDQDEDFKEDEVEAFDQEDIDFQNDWVDQIGNAKLEPDEKAALENAYMEHFKITRKEAKTKLKEQFFQKKKFEEKMNIREQANKRRKRHKEIKKLFDTMQKRSLEKLDYENDEGYKKENELNPGEISENSNNFNLAIEKLQERVNSDQKEVLYDKWEIAKKRYAKNVKFIIEDAILESKFNLSTYTKQNSIHVEDVVISSNGHFVYILWDFLDSGKNLQNDIQKFKEEISFNLNKEKYEIESKLFFMLHLRKKPNVIFIHSDKDQQAQLFKQDYIKQQLQKKLQYMKQKYPEYYDGLINSGNYNKYIDEQTKLMDAEIGDEFEEYFNVKAEMRQKENKIKKQLQEQKKLKKDKKNRALNPKKKNKKNQNKAAKFWSKISTN